MRSAHLRLGAAAAVISLLAACSNDVTSPSSAPINGISARGGSSTGGGGGGGGGGSTTGSQFTGVVDSTKNVDVGTYYPSIQTVWYSGSHAFRANSLTKIRSSSDLPLLAGACAAFTYSTVGTIETVSDVKVLTVDKCAI